METSLTFDYGHLEEYPYSLTDLGPVFMLPKDLELISSSNKGIGLCYLEGSIKMHEYFLVHLLCAKRCYRCLGYIGRAGGRGNRQKSLP